MRAFTKYQGSGVSVHRTRIQICTGSGAQHTGALNASLTNVRRDRARAIG